MSVVRCPICRAPARHSENIKNLVHSFECVRCGSFRCDHYAVITLKRAQWSDPQIGTVSGYVRRNSGMFLTSDDVDRLKGLIVPTVGEKAARLLLELGREYPVPGESFWAPVFDVQTAFQQLGSYRGDDSLPEKLMSDPVIVNLRWLAIASAADANELYWFFFEYFLPHGWLGKGATDGQITITPTGWQEFSRLQQANLASRIGFVAMSFRDEFKPLYDHGIEPGIRAAGYEAVRVDRTEHNNRIDDEIVAISKRSRFLVADFSVNRGGIYFESGFAFGLGIPVIWLVKDDQLAAVHFDTRQYNFIIWSENAWESLRDRLQYRIEATIGRGPVVSQKT